MLRNIIFFWGKQPSSLLFQMMETAKENSRAAGDENKPASAF